MNPGSKILVRTPNWIGDHVMAIPFYAALRKTYPQSEITFLCPEVLKDFDDQIWRDSKIILTTEERKSKKSFVSKALSLRAEKYDLALSLPASLSSALFLFLTGAKNRVGFTVGGGDLFYHSSLAWRGNSSGQHKSQLYLSLLDFLTTHHSSKVDLMSTVAVSKEDYFVVAPGASLPLREYPYFSELLILLTENYPHTKVIVIGSKEEEKYSSKIKRLNLPNIENRIGKTSLNEVIEVCRKAKLVISNDSGVAHLSASLAGANTLVLMGPGDPDYILPLGGRAYPVRVEKLPCSPCEKSYCRAAYGYQACLKELLPERIIERMKTLTL